jgi:acyl-coenzyme A thioesterase PaaI-like protein
VADTTRYDRAVLGELIIRAEGDSTCHVRLFPLAHHVNVGGQIHGGITSLDAVVDVLRETGRLGFMRGLVVQEDDLVASFTGILRKPGKTR